MEDPVLEASSSSMVELTSERCQSPLPSSETTLPDHVHSQLLASSTENVVSKAGNHLVKDALSKSIGPLVAEASEEAPKPTEVIARGIASVFGPVMKDFCTGVDGALKSQSVLASSIGRLTREFDKLLEDVPLPFAAQHATKLSGVRKRVLSLNSTLHIIQTRMDDIERMLSGNVLKTMEKGKHGRDPTIGFTQGSLPAATSLSTQISSVNAEVYPVVTLHASRRNSACQNYGQDENHIQNQQVESFDANIDEINSQAHATAKDSAPLPNGLDLTGFSGAGPFSALEEHIF